MEKPNHYEEGKTKSMIIESIVRDPCSRVKLKERMSSIVDKKSIDYHLDREGKGLKNRQITRKGIKLAPILEEKDGTLSLIYSRESLISCLHYILENNELVRVNFSNLLFLAYISPFGERELLTSDPYFIRGNTDWAMLMSETRGEIDIELAVSYFIMTIMDILNFQLDNSDGKLKTYFDYSLAFRSNESIKEDSKKATDQLVKFLIEDLISVPIKISNADIEEATSNSRNYVKRDRGMQWYSKVPAEEIEKVLNEAAHDVGDLKSSYLQEKLRLSQLLRFGAAEKEVPLMSIMTYKLNTLLHSDIIKSEKYLRKVPLLPGKKKGIFGRILST